MKELLEIKGLVGGYEKDVNILQGIDMVVAPGETVGIIGLNGSGKSTLAKALMNLLPFRSGLIMFGGQDVSERATHRLSRMGIALMQQGGVVFPTLSVWQNLSLARGSKTFIPHYEQLKQIIPLLNEPNKDLMRTMADKLSGGQRHELALAMTLSRNPKLVILDEPSAGLSPKAVKAMYGMLEAIRKQFGVSIVLIEQNVHQAVNFCDRCLMIKMGVVAGEFVSKDVMEIENLMFETERI